MEWTKMEQMYICTARSLFVRSHPCVSKLPVRLVTPNGESSLAWSQVIQIHTSYILLCTGLTPILLSRILILKVGMPWQIWHNSSNWNPSNACAACNPSWLWTIIANSMKEVKRLVKCWLLVSVTESAGQNPHTNDEVPLEFSATEAEANLCPMVSSSPNDQGNYQHEGQAQIRGETCWDRSVVTICLKRTRSSVRPGIFHIPLYMVITE